MNAAMTSSADLVGDNERRDIDGSENVVQRRISFRLCCLDTFRGLAIVTMIFANSGAGKYKWLEHATWNGLHSADLIFPSFLWIMGVCIPISIKSQVTKNVPCKRMLRDILYVSVKSKIYSTSMLSDSLTSAPFCSTAFVEIISDWIVHSHHTWATYW